MKFTKIAAVGLAGMAALSLTACASGSGDKKLTIYNQKPEIEKALKDYADAWGKKNNITVEVKTCGGTCDYATQLNSDFTSGNEPDLFMIEGKGGAEKNKDRITDLSGESWVSGTDFALKGSDGKVQAFPITVEGFGLTYNKDILTKAGIDPMKLTTIDAYKDAFNKLNEKKAELGIEAPVSLSAAPKMEWVMGNHNFNTYLSAGLKNTDKSVIDNLNAGKADAKRITDYANWVELLYNNTDKTTLTTADYDAMVNKFHDGKTAFLHQGNWADPNLKDVAFDMGIAPQAYSTTETNQIFVGAAMYWVANNKADMTTEAKKFLSDIVSTTEGQKFVTQDAALVSPFKEVGAKAENAPKSKLAKSLVEWINKGGTYAWNQNDMPSDFGTKELGPVFTKFATSGDKAAFENSMTATIEKLKK